MQRLAAGNAADLHRESTESALRCHGPALRSKSCTTLVQSIRDALRQDPDLPLSVFSHHAATGKSGGGSSESHSCVTSPKSCRVPTAESPSSPN